MRRSRLGTGVSSRYGAVAWALPLLLPLGCQLLLGCQPGPIVPWTSLAAIEGPLSGTAPRSAVLPGGAKVEFEFRQRTLWGKLELRREAWQESTLTGVIMTPAPLLGLGRPAYRLEIDGVTCEQVTPLGEDESPRKSLAPNTFGCWRNTLFLGVEPGAAAPEEATLRVRLDPGGRDELGQAEVRGRRFSGLGFAVWPGRRVERDVDLPSNACLRFATVVEPASASHPPEQKLLFRILVDRAVVFEHEQAVEPAGSSIHHRVPLPEKSDARLVLEVEGPFAYTSFLDPVLGPEKLDARSLPSRPSIALFLADGLRADNLAAYGGKGGVTPELDRFAERSLRFTHTWSSGTSTLPAHVSLLSGLYPRQTSSGAGPVFPAEVESLAEVLARAGYRTGAITDSGTLSLRTGMRQGFDSFDECDLELDSTLARARAFLDADDGRPCFLVVQTLRMNMPYREREPPGSVGLPDPTGTEEFQRLMAGLVELGGPRIAMERDPERARELARELEVLYRRVASDLDRGFGEFWRDLASRGFAERGYVLFTSSHGEAFYEHGQLAHRGRVFEEQLRVPLLIHGPGVSARPIELGASLVDLAPTIAALARVAPLPYWQGADLLKLTRERTLFAFECAPSDSSVAILAGTHKLIAVEDPRERRLAAPWHAFDLAQDPDERHDILGVEAWPDELFRASAPMVEGLLSPLVTGKAVPSDEQATRPEQSAGPGGD